MTAHAVISNAMHASLKALLGRACTTAAIEIDRQIDTRTVYPMTTITKAYTFTLHPPGDTLREFTVTVSLAEQGTPDNSPTAGWVA